MSKFGILYSIAENQSWVTINYSAKNFMNCIVLFGSASKKSRIGSVQVRQKILVWSFPSFWFGHFLVWYVYSMQEFLKQAEEIAAEQLQKKNSKMNEMQTQLDSALSELQKYRSGESNKHFVGHYFMDGDC